MSMVAVHARRARRLAEEEEEVTRYDPADLADGWEFKIMRSAMGDFGKPEVLRGMIQDEAAAGWELLEKLDNNRVRMKRPVAVRERDVMLPKGYDPYRTTFGWSDTRMAFTIMAAIFGVIVAVVAAIWVIEWAAATM